MIQGLKEIGCESLSEQYRRMMEKDIIRDT
jgi:hypothetical protein